MCGCGNPYELRIPCSRAQSPPYVACTATGPRTGRKRLGTATLCGATALAAVLAAGCGSVRHAPGASRATVPASQALKLAAKQAQHFTSVAATITGQISGLHAATITCSVRMQTKPAVIVYAAFNVSAPGHPLPGGMQEIITGHSLHLKAAPLARKFGKPWVKVSAGPLVKPSATGLGQLSPFGQSLGPAGTDPLSSGNMLAAAQHVRVVGMQTVRGVQTTSTRASTSCRAGSRSLRDSERAQDSRENKADGPQAHAGMGARAI